MHNDENIILLQFATITTLIIIAKLIRHLNQAAVLGQLFAGMLIAIFAHYKFSFFMTITDNNVFAFLAQLGSIFLLLEIGLESNLSEIVQSGKQSILVALTGVIVPFIVGYCIVTPIILNNITNAAELLNNNPLMNDVTLSIFIGSMLAVTSTGISISVFKELHMLRSKACQIVLAASIIDDIIGLTLLSIITSLAISSSISIMSISSTIFYIILFFIFSIIFGQKILPKIINLISLISRNADTLVLIMISYALCMSFIAASIGLAAVIGAFLAGMLLDKKYFNLYSYPNYFKRMLASESTNSNPEIKINDTINNINNNEVQNKDGEQPSINPINLLEHLVRPFGKLLTPVFFIYAGMQVDIIGSCNYNTLVLTLVISLFAIGTKLVAGIWLPKTSNRLIVGIGMVPRGEIGLIFAISGLSLKIIDHEIFAALVLMIVITSVFTPPVLTYATKRAKLLTSS